MTKHQAARTFSHSNKLKERLAELKIVDPLAVDLLQKLLDLDPTKRIGAGDAATVSIINLSIIGTLHLISGQINLLFPLPAFNLLTPLFFFNTEN